MAPKAVNLKGSNWTTKIKSKRALERAYCFGKRVSVLCRALSTHSERHDLSVNENKCEGQIHSLL